MAEFDVGFGSEYLTPYQELMETRKLGQRALEESIRTNPLVQRDTTVLAGAAPPTATPVTATASTVQPNPLTRPPVPLSVMGTEQRIAWEDRSAKQAVEQAALENQRLITAVKKSENDVRLEQIRQGNEIMASDIPVMQAALNKGNLDEYLNLKADLFRRRPVGVGSPEIEKALKPLDDLYTKNLAFQETDRRTRETRTETNLQKRVNEGYEEAKKLGPEVWAQYAAKVDKDPENAIKYVTDLAIPAQRENAIQKLKDAGFPEDQIAQRYGTLTGADFNYQAAAEATKTRTAASQERARITQHWALLDKKKKDSAFDPDPDAWTPALEEELKATTAEMLATTPKVGDNRGGVAGMGAREGESLYKGYRPVTAQQPTTTQPVAPAVPVRPSFSVGGGGAQQYGTRAVAPTGTAAAPAAPREKQRVNPKTGHIIVLRNGAWVDPQTGKPVS